MLCVSRWYGIKIKTEKQTRLFYRWNRTREGRGERGIAVAIAHKAEGLIFFGTRTLSRFVKRCARNLRDIWMYINPIQEAKLTKKMRSRRGVSEFECVANLVCSSGT